MSSAFPKSFQTHHLCPSVQRLLHSPCWRLPEGFCSSSSVVLFFFIIWLFASVMSLLLTAVVAVSSVFSTASGCLLGYFLIKRRVVFLPASTVERNSWSQSQPWDMLGTFLWSSSYISSPVKNIATIFTLFSVSWLRRLNKRRLINGHVCTKLI